MITPDIFDIENLQTLLDENKEKEVLELLKGLHPVDLAEIITDLSTEQSISIIKLIGHKDAARAIIELEDSQCDKILELVSSDDLSEFLRYLDTDDAADIVGRLDSSRREEVLKAIKKPEYALKIIELLRYKENTAGGLMGKELVSINENWDINEALKEIKIQAENVRKIHSIYVVNNDYKLKGRISIKDILTNPPKKLIKDLYINDVKHVSVHEKEDEVSMMMSKYNLESIPVTDESGHLVGRITIDDIIDVMKYQADKDYQMAAGITSDVESNPNVWRLTKARLPWLLIGSIGGMGAATAISKFGTLLTLHPVLMIFIPLIQSTAGNVGVQSSAIVVQSIASKTVNKNFIKRLLKEIGVGLVNGACITLLVLIIAHFAFHISPNIALTVGIALITIVLNAGIIGTFVPFLLNKNNIDPALATGPFITTGGDILGILIYFLIAKLILHI